MMSGNEQLTPFPIYSHVWITQMTMRMRPTMISQGNEIPFVSEISIHP